MQNQYEKMFGKRVMMCSLLVRVPTTINHISICFLPQYQRQRKCFSSERELKKALRDTSTQAAWYVPTSQCYVIKQMVNAIACTIELWMHFRGLLSTQEARVALGYHLMRLLRFFCAQQPPACTHSLLCNSTHYDVKHLLICDLHTCQYCVTV